MIKLFYIAGGGAIGSISRYWMSGIAHRFFESSFPWGTLVVNLTGSLAIGLLWGLSEAVTLSQNIKLLLFIGILGSFTTFSTFSLENFHLIRDGEYWFAAANIFASIFFGVILAFGGYFAVRYAITLIK